MSKAAADTYVLASAEKLDAASPYKVVELSQITGIITEAGTNDELVRPTPLKASSWSEPDSERSGATKHHPPRDCKKEFGQEDRSAQV